jgi:mannose-6-phosphate isomerase-like protein (cupin superfamily)
MSMHTFLQSGNPAHTLEHDIHITANRMQITIKKLSSSDDCVIMVEHLLPPRSAGLPPYVHMAVTKALYVAEGTLSVARDAAFTTAHAGQFLAIPPGVVHSCWNATDAPVRFVMCFAPADIRAYFDELAMFVLDNASSDAAVCYERMLMT